MRINELSVEKIGTKIVLEKVKVDKVEMFEYKSKLGYTVIINVYDDYKTNNYVQLINFLNKKDETFNEKLEFYKGVTKGDVLGVEGFLNLVDTDNQFNYEFLTINKPNSNIKTKTVYYQVKIENIQKYPSTKSIIKEYVNEINLYSKYSAYNSLVDLNNLKELLINNNTTNIAITDYSNTSIFPIAEKTFKNSGVKVVYGSEINISDEDGNPFSINQSKIINKDIRDLEIVIYDFETSGLVPINDELIEIGAIKCVYNKENEKFEIVDEFEVLIKPKKPISKEIEKITNITNEMLNESSINEQEGLEKFYEFIGDSEVLVGHNVNFDYNFLRQRTLVNKINFDDTKFSTICTLLLSNYVFNIIQDINIKYLSLDSVLKKYNVKVENHHRALPDVKTTLELYNLLIFGVKKKNDTYKNESLFSLGKTKINDIVNDYKNEVNSRFPSSMLVYAKNQEGLTSLYNLLTLVNVDYNKGRTLPLSTLLAHKDNLILVANGFRSDIYNDLLNGIVKKHKWFKYDYIGLHDSYGTNDIELIKKVNKMIFNFSDKFEIKNTFLGNVRYLKEIEKNFYEILSVEYKRGKNNNINRNDFKENHLKTNKEVIERFNYVDEKVVLEMLNNNKMFFSNFDEITIVTNNLNIPNLPNSVEKVKELAESKLFKLYGDNVPKEIRERYEYEASKVLEKYSSLMLATTQVVNQTISLGEFIESRGSVGGSLLAYLLNITDLNPMSPHYYCKTCKKIEWVKEESNSGFNLPTKKCEVCNEELLGDGHSLSFEVFLGFDGTKTPDVDLNFGSDFREKAHDMVREIFGEENVIRCGNIGTLSEATIKRMYLDYLLTKYESKKNILGIAKNNKNEIIKKNDFWQRTKKGFELLPIVEPIINGITIHYLKSDKDIESGIEIESVYTVSIPMNLTYLKKIIAVLEGVRTTYGTHPSGLLVKKEGTEFNFPFAWSSDGNSESMVVTQIGYHEYENDYLKMDMLGHDNPVKIKKLKKLTNIDFYDIPNNDEKVFEAFLKGETIGIPEFNKPSSTKATVEILESVIKQGDTIKFSHLVDISNLTHGTGVYEGNIKDLILSGVKIEETPSSRERILEFLEKYVSNVDAFRIMEGVRKGKGIKENDLQLLKDKNVPQYYIDSMLKIEYLFTKSHATAYVQSAYKLMWYKIRKPLEFSKIILESEISDSKVDWINLLLADDEFNKLVDDVEDKVTNFKANDREEASITAYKIVKSLKEKGFGVLKIDLNNSAYDEFKIVGDNLLLPFKAIPNINKNLVDKIIEMRKEKELSFEDIKSISKSDDMIKSIEKFI